MTKHEYMPFVPRRYVPPLFDRTGMNELRVNLEVQITHPRHAYYESVGVITKVDKARHRVWVNLPDGTTVPAGNRSVQSHEQNRTSRA